MRNTRVLISGAGIAGLAQAYWLERHGFDVTVVERAAEPRPGGQAIDVRGTALTVAERMGILADLRRLKTDMRGSSMVDGSGNELYSSTERTFSGGPLDGPDVEIMRDDLVGLLREAAGDRVEYLFDDSIAAIAQDEEGAHVTFESGVARSYDLVVGADGLHSNVRRLVFGPETDFIQHLGMYVGVYTAPNFLGLDRWQTFCMEDGVGGGVMTARGNTEVRVYVGFSSEEPLDYDYRDIEAQKRLLADRVGDVWVFPTALKYMWDAPDFHFDGMAQIHMDRWARGRVVLLGDAGYCGSPMSGQGTSMALIGAYVLAGELAAAGGDHEAGFAAYEAELRDFVAKNQALALVDRDRLEASGEDAVPDDDIARLMEVVNSLTLKDYAPAGDPANVRR
ncbi:FAD-dependent monooxygenase [Actinoallomurus rhizosphaericola]|uniref:FAD-dependent monooxygenase n=1 Tax=Actinoallomurus rhizosphaericola TaxID=2952536 RepID=UPI0020922E45|nr:FAD-dependent monooxygenase [Actinoallomurus rhizosphaericola]MCO5998533.1 FAD-dependent monooxygenase [Actinoallomurus rhizosphaericola]